ncbi:extracellular solute-binding protein [Bacillus sp. JCM 19034]|uniref:extracellular solute-binding protein n=1 Tax=Bacillus sp. JCM 19034 TaxID=1481928 RepID=UPI00078353E2|nr:extracellular solute-binding protein [Bacillus sp. JCM 19034]
MNKQLTFLLGISFLVVVLAACGGGQNKIDFWTPLTGEDGANMDAIVQAFNETEPEIEINHVVTSDLYTNLYTVLNSGSGIPDLTLIHADRVPNFVKQDLLETMDEVMALQPELKEENYIEEAWTSGVVDGTVYTIPLDIHGSAMYYNRELLQKYGVEHWLDDDVVTFDEMLELQGQLDEGQYVLNDALIGWVIMAQLQNLGGDVEDENGNPAVNTPEMKQAIEAIKELADKGLMTPYGEDGYLLFQSGDVIFSTDGTWSSLGHGMVEDLDFGVTNIYAFEPDVFHNRASSHLFSMLKSDERTEEEVAVIADFLEFVRENSMEWAEAGQIVASVDVIESPEYENYMQHFFTKNEKQENSLYIYTYEHYPYVAEAVDTYAPDLIHGQMDIDEGLAEMQSFVVDRVEQGTLDLETVIEELEEEEE